MQFILALVPLLAAFVTAAPAAAVLEDRAATTCGKTSYSAAQVNAASQQACTYYKNNQQANSYPHTYNNYEGFNFRVAGPYQEFPIKSSGVYTGGSPGADRVIINTNCEQAGAITHTGAKGNNFVGCSGTS
ncbi:Guanyl-specific ribonuclease F1 [Apiospora aurea]|uniref:ribonuclease T1 n=1 Tax=Apiospora aurea TaxID=335848 RepID=A0ABR1Q103_9PEZI